ncbi:N-acetyltransferase GCN5 [Mycolicibacterium flavescens]|uniref:GNAT family N-acetyltransferase n=1 Tax=Mycobacterium neumannii TaxID=2048551 RepID=UPI000B945C0A|nr:GNAT family N-acetyltransferase [Mycobacterium neumannii]VEG39194.1 N-acetyltransferase GCN5 [Mycolicibacterium flavescens]
MRIADRLPRGEGNVTVRRLRHGDAHAFAAGTDDDAVRRFAHLPLREYSAEIVREQIDGVIARGLADDTLAVLAIADAWSDGFLGSIVLFDIHEFDAEVGFWLAPQGRGRGAARQGLSAVVGLATEAGLTRLTARTAPKNDGSRRVLEGVGFVLADGPRDEVTPSGEAMTVVTYEYYTP